MKTALYSFKQPGGVVNIEDQSLSTGARFFVDSGSAGAGDTVGNGRNPDKPFATLAYAFSSDIPTASKGDIIYVMPGHAETLATAAVLPMDIAGVKVLGLGWLGSKPTLTITTGDVAAPILISADDIIVDNINIVGGKAGGSKTAIEITSDDVTLSHIDFTSGASTELGIGADYGIITLLDSAGAITGVKIINCTCVGGAGNDESFISVTDSSNGATNVTIEGCKIIGTFVDDVIQADQGTNVNTGWVIRDSLLSNLAATGTVITLDTGAVFHMYNLTIESADANAAPIVGFNVSFMNNVFSCEPGAYGATTVIGSVTNWGA